MSCISDWCYNSASSHTQCKICCCLEVMKPLTCLPEIHCIQLLQWIYNNMLLISETMNVQSKKTSSSKQMTVHIVFPLSRSWAQQLSQHAGVVEGSMWESCHAYGTSTWLDILPFLSHQYDFTDCTSTVHLTFQNTRTLQLTQKLCSKRSSTRTEYTYGQLEIYVYKAVQCKSNFQHTGTCSVIPWPPCCLCHHPAVVFCHFISLHFYSHIEKLALIQSVIITIFVSFKMSLSLKLQKLELCLLGNVCTIIKITT
jgi:hypothetical protein